MAPMIIQRSPCDLDLSAVVWAIMLLNYSPNLSRTTLLLNCLAIFKKLFVDDLPPSFLPLRTFAGGEWVMIHIRPKHQASTHNSKLHMWGAVPFKVLKWIHTNVFVIDILKNLAIHLIFNVTDLVPYHSSIVKARGSKEHPKDWNKEYYMPSPTLGKCWTIARDHIESIVDYQTIPSAHDEASRFLVQW